MANAGVCSSSSGESIISSSEEYSFLVEEVIEEEEGESELVLEPKRVTCERISDKPGQPDETFLGGAGYTDFFLACVSSLKQEELIKRSPRGQRVTVLLEALEESTPDDITSVAISLVTKVSACFDAGNKHKLPSAAQACVWSTFHQLRANKELKQMWITSVLKFIPEQCRKEPHLTLQLIMDRILKKLIKNKAEATKHRCETVTVRPLTSMESNAVRYMAGYVAVTLLKKYKKPAKNPQLKTKRKLFVKVLTSMKAVDQLGEPESVSEYTKQWSELIDRGGLYNIDDKVFGLMQSIELVVRRHLNIENAMVFTPGVNLRKAIMEDVILSDAILHEWETIACSIPSSHEPYSIELLRAITDLWITIRGHSFTKNWTMNFTSKYKKGTRKTLREKQ